MRKYFIETGFWGRLFVFMCLTVFLMLGAVIMGDILAVLIFGKDAMVAMEVPVVQFLQTFLSIGLFLLPPVLMVRLCCEGSLGDNLMVSKPPRPLPLLVCIAAIVVSEPMVSWLEEVNMRMTLPDSMSSIEDWMREREQSAADIVRKLTAPPDTLNYIINLGVLALLPGLCEEMFFRVGVQTRLFADKTRIRGIWAVVVTAVLLLRLSQNGKIKGDAMIAIISSSALAIGVICVSVTTGMNTEVSSYMFGSILSLSRSDAILSAILSAAVLVLFVLFYPRLFAVTFDETFSKATGTKTELYNTLLAVLTAVTVVLGMRMMGALLISSLIIFPALSAMRVCSSFKRVVICAAYISVACFVLGTVVSYFLETPTGASIVAANLLCFFACCVIGRK